MTPERWQELQRILDDVLDLPVGERAAFMERHCPDPEARQQLQRLVDAAESVLTAFDKPPLRLTSSRGPVDPEKLGAYRLMDRLGRGGMGTVFVARRDDDVHHRPVAIKLMQVGLESDELMRRFRREREILAHLEHPNIARLLDGGTSEDGRPFLVMELVEGGVMVDQYCREHALDIPARLRLFQKVCAAVHFAHQQLVVHRDLKPGNILVTPEGEPKLLDFGIAKLLSTEDFPLTVVTTAPGRSPMTPSWASPEQMRGERISTASDIYSLGILLYRLLCDQHPYRLDGCNYAEAVRIVCEQEPLAPSVQALNTTTLGDDAKPLARQLYGDLDDIVLKALRKDARTRYSSAEELAKDIERHLTGLPVEARKGTFTYRASKFVRRHRVGVASGVTALVLLLGFIAALLVQQKAVIAQRDLYEATAQYLIGIFEKANPKEALEMDLSARDLLERGVEDLEEQLSGQPEVQAEMHTVIGSSFHGLGQLERARQQLQSSLALRRELYGDKDPKIADSLQRLSQVESDSGRYEEAEDYSRRALEIRRAIYDPPHPELTDSMFRLAWILERRGDYGQATVHYRQALEAARQLDEPELLAEILTDFAILQRLNAEQEESEQLLDEALTIRRRIFGDYHALTIDTRNSLALLYEDQGRFELAEKSFREALEAARQIYDDPHNTLASLTANLASTLSQRGEYEAAEGLYKEALDIYHRFYDGPHPNTATHLGRLAFLYQRMDRHEEAAEMARRALDMRRILFDDSHKDVALSCNYLAVTLTRLDEYDEAEQLFQEAIAIYRKTVGDSHPQLAKSLNNYASLLFEQDRQDEAKELFSQALDILRQVYGDEHPEVGNLSYNLGYLRHQAGELERAAELYQRAADIARFTLGEDHPNVGIILTQQGRLANDRGDHIAAEQAARQALEVLEARLPWEHVRRIKAEIVLTRSLLAQDRVSDAENALRPRFGWIQQQRSRDDANRQDIEALMQSIEDQGG